jgi:hypothetical protein
MTDGAEANTWVVVIGAVVNGVMLILTLYLTYKKDVTKQEVESLRKLTAEQQAHIAEQDRKIDHCDAEKDKLQRSNVIHEARIYALENALTDAGIKFRRWTDADPARADETPAEHRATDSATHRTINQPRPEDPA